MLARHAGVEAVRLARREAEAEVLRSRATALPPGAGLEEARGCFVSLHRGGELRGCVGFAEPVRPLREALREAARGAVRDPRFEPVRPRELDALTVEVSVLGLPVPVRAADPLRLPESLRIGEHGLLLQAGRRRALLLPQVALEQGLTPEAFLAACCAKAGLDPDAWRKDGLRWHVFGSQVFREAAPRGEVRAHEEERPEVA